MATMFYPDQPPKKDNCLIPSLENINVCFNEIIRVVSETEPNGEYYTLNDSFHSKHIKCLFALQAANLIELKSYNYFRLKSKGYEAFQGGSYIDFILKENIGYFILEAMKSEDNISYENLIQSSEKKSENDFLKLLKSQGAKVAITTFYKELVDLMKEQF